MDLSAYVVLQLMGAMAVGMGIMAFIQRFLKNRTRPRTEGGVVAGLPWMKNLLAIVFAALATFLLVITAEGLFDIDLPEVAWGIAGGVLTKLFDVVLSIVEMYRTMIVASLDQPEPTGDGEEDA